MFHPSAGAAARARLSLSAERVLAVGEGGERWVTDPDGRAEAAARAAPEPLIGVGRLGDRFAFAGASGRVYLAGEALGPFREVREAPEGFVDVSAAEGALSAVHRDGSLWSGVRWGERWQRAEAPNGWAARVVLGTGGSGWALAVPERWWTTQDHGRSWLPADLPPVGARDLRRTDGGDLEVQGLFGTFRPVGASWRTLSARSEKQSSAEPPGPAPDAARLAEGTAVIDGGVYFALVREGAEQGAREGAGTGRNWQVLQGVLGARLESRAAQGLPASCGEVVVAKRGPHVAVLCGTTRTGAASAPLTLWSSADGGKTFRQRRVTLRGVWQQLRVAVSRDGVVVLSGVCAPHLAAAGCAPRGVYRVRLGASRLEPLPLPGLPSADALTFGSAENLYVVGSREKDQHLTLYVSLDGAKSFAVRDLEVGAVTSERRSRAKTPGVDLAVDEDGTLAVALRLSGRTVVVALDAAGHVLSRGEAPSGAQAVSAVGLRALAVDPKTRSLWESLDGGSSWELTPLPRPLCSPIAPIGSSTDAGCEVALACAPSGCVLGDSLSRLGWGTRETLALPTGRDAGSAAGRSAERRTPVACVFGSEPWQSLEGVHAVPGAPDAAAGRMHWFAVSFDPESGAVAAVHAPENQRNIERRELFGAVSEPTHYALAVLDQVEGSAALRYRVPHASRGEREITGVELAWDNRFEDVLGRARVEGTFRPLPGDYHSRASRTLSAEPALLSVAGRGVFLRLHSSAEDAQVTFYAEGRSVEKVPPVPWPRSPVTKRTEMIRLAGQSVPLAFYGEGQWLAFFRPGSSAPPPGDHAFRALAIGLPEPRAAGLVQSVSLAYTGNAPSVFVVQASPAGHWWRAYTAPLLAEGEPIGPAVAAPLQPDLSDPPAPCDAAVRRNTARVVAPPFPGEPHPVLLTDPVDAPRLLFTGRAVLHGSPEQPCVAAFEAAELRPQRSERAGALGNGSNAPARERTFALLPTGDLSNAWAFQEVSESRWHKRIQARPMSCRYDSSLTLPPELLHGNTL